MIKTKLLFLCTTLICLCCACGEQFVPAKPTPEQLAFQDLELGVFVHYSIDAYAERGVIPGQTPASDFNPTELDVNQWVEAAKEMGAKFMVLTARHEQGFCIWPTKTTDYSIQYSPYKDGKGDIVREFVDACRKHGIKPGLYTAPWIDSHWESIYLGYKGGDTGDINKLNDPELYAKAWAKEKEQLTELMTNYGDLVILWNDHFGRSDALSEEHLGGKLRTFYADFTKHAHELQPGCLILGRDIEHVGQEKGYASYPLWNSLNTIDSTLYSISETYRWNYPNTGNPHGKFYRPQLAPTTDALSKGGWMWHNYRQPQPLEVTMKAYYETVGRGSSVIINFAPDRRGRVEDQVIEAAKAFGKELKRRFDHPIVTSEAADSKQIIKFDAPTTINHVVSMEDLREGQRIAAYTIEAEVNGKWQTIVNGQTIGHKRIDQFEDVTATALRFTVTEAVAKPKMRSIAVYNVTPAQSIEGFVKHQMDSYPQLRLLDIYKSCFQDYMGAEHLVTDKNMVKAYLDEELNTTTLDDLMPGYYEPCGTNGNYVRVSIRAIKENLISDDLLLDAFIRSANSKERPTVETWRDQWHKMVDTIDKMELNLPNYQEDRQFIDSILSIDKYAISHSPEFREAYHPHYRIVERGIFEREIKPLIEKAKNVP